MRGKTALRVRALVVVVNCLGAAPNSPSGAAAARCSLRYSVVPRYAGQVWFLGSALADTVYAGPGTVAITGEGPGHAGPGGPGAFRGQLVQVERLEPRAPKEFAQAVRASGGQVVLVAWDYDAACQRLPRMARADWIRAGTRGLYQGTLRTRQEWAGRLPTLDVFAPEFVPYPSPPGLHRQPNDATRPWASAEELFDFVAAVPTARPGASERGIEELNDWLRRWAREHPRLALLQPIAEEIGMIRGIWLKQRASYHRLKSPIAGTWRFEVTMATGDTLRFFARTTETPISAAYDSVGAFGLPDDSDMRPPVSYDLYTKFSIDAAALDSVHAIDDPGTTEGYFELVTEPLIHSRDSTVWRGGLPVHSIARRLFASLPQGVFMEYLQAQRRGDSTALAGLRVRGLSVLWHQLFVADSFWMTDRFSKRDGARFQGRFVLTRDGRLRGEDQLLTDSRPLLTIRAERIDGKYYRGEMVPRPRH